VLQQWFAHFCSSSLQVRLQREKTTLHTVAAVVCMEDYDKTTHCCSSDFIGETTTDCTVSQLWFAGKTTSLHTIAAVVCGVETMNFYAQPDAAERVQATGTNNYVQDLAMLHQRSAVSIHTPQG